MFPELAENQKFFPDMSKFYPKITEFFRKHQNTKTNPIINQRPLGKKCNLIAQSLCSRKKGTFEKLGGGARAPSAPPFPTPPYESRCSWLDCPFSVVARLLFLFLSTSLSTIHEQPATVWF
jgi:hypothetical protein